MLWWLTWKATHKYNFTQYRPVEQQCGQGSHISLCISLNLINNFLQNQAISSDFDMGMKTERVPTLLLDMKNSFFIGNTTGMVQTDVFLSIMRSWHFIWIVSEHFGLASQSILGLVLQVHELLRWHLLATRGLHASSQRENWISKHKFRKGRLSVLRSLVEHRSYQYFSFQQNSLICPINSNSGCVPLPLQSET